MSASEKTEVLDSLTASIAALDEDVARAKTEEGGRRTDKLEERRAALAARRLAIEKSGTVVHRLRRGEDVSHLSVQHARLASGV